MLITGRLTSDAKVKTLKDKRQVLTFSLAVNNLYTTQGEKRDETDFYQCSYWVSMNASKVLTKGNIVELTGRVGLNAYKSQNNDFNAFLTFHVNFFKVLHRHKAGTSEPLASAEPDENKDDLPF